MASPVLQTAAFSKVFGRIFSRLSAWAFWKREEILVTGVTPITSVDHRSWTRTLSSLEPTFRLQSLLRSSSISLDFLSVLTSTSALAKAGYKVIHVDPNDYYGGDHATLNVDEIISWANLRSSSAETENSSEYLAGQRNRFVSVSYHGSPPPASRQYSLSLSPSIIPSVGPLISTLVNSGVSRYGGFKLLEKVALYRSPGRVQNVPNSKEDVFNDRHISLIDKRRLMRFFTFVSGDFKDKPELHGKESASFIDFLTSTFTLERTIAETIVFALAFCSSPQGLWLPLQSYRRCLYKQSQRCRL